MKGKYYFVVNGLIQIVLILGLFLDKEPFKEISLIYVYTVCALTGICTFTYILLRFTFPNEIRYVRANSYSFSGTRAILGIGQALLIAYAGFVWLSIAYISFWLSSAAVLLYHKEFCAKHNA